MTQRFLSPRFIAATTLALATASVFAAACGSDKRSEGTEGNMLEPDPSASAGGTAGSGAGGDTGAPTANAGAGTVSTGGSEMQPGETPIDPGVAGAGGADTTLPPAPTVTANCNPPEGDVPALALSLVADGLDDPIYVTGAPGDDSRLFVLEKPGRVRVLVDGALQDAPFLDIVGQIVNGNETGLLGIAFHPAYATNGLFYVHYSSTATDGVEAGDGVVAEFSVNPNDRSLANAESERRVLVVSQPEANHNGGEITFGPDGFMYLGFGDGGGGNDQHGPIGNGQALNTLLGKILRIDPLGREVNAAYSIPAGNMGGAALGEIWAYGLRNPWRFSFDACGGDLYIADVGQTTLEEIDFLPRSSPSGTNFGWRIMEGPNCRVQNNVTDAVCAQAGTAGLTLPIDSYPRDVGRSVTGGYVYRGSDVPGLRGYYIYADYATARFFRFRVENGQVADRQEITGQLLAGANANVADIASFGQDNDGEVYVAAFNPGAVYRITAAAP